MRWPDFKDTKEFIEHVQKEGIVQRTREVFVTDLKSMGISKLKMHAANLLESLHGDDAVLVGKCQLHNRRNELEAAKDVAELVISVVDQEITDELKTRLKWEPEEISLHIVLEKLVSLQCDVKELKQKQETDTKEIIHLKKELAKQVETTEMLRNQIEKFNLENTSKMERTENPIKNLQEPAENAEIREYALQETEKEEKNSVEEQTGTELAGIAEEIEVEHIYLTNLHPDTTECTIEKHCTNRDATKPIKINFFRGKYGLYKSAKLTIYGRDKKKMLSSGFWPSTIKYREWEIKRQGQKTQYNSQAEAQDYRYQQNYDRKIRSNSYKTRRMNHNKYDHNRYSRSSHSNRHYENSENDNCWTNQDQKEEYSRQGYATQGYLDNSNFFKFSNHHRRSGANHIQ